MANFDDINKELDRIKRFIETDVREIIGTEAVNHFTENFENQSFDGKKWKDVKRRDPNSTWYGFQYGSKVKKPSNHPSRRGTTRKYVNRKDSPITNYSPTAAKRPILSSKRSELENSILYKVRGNRVTIFSDKDYSNVHNDGGRISVFGNKTTTVPKRQFIGVSKKLEQRIYRQIEKKFKTFR